MAGNEPASVEQDLNTEPSLDDFEQSLLSFEKLDRTSPEIWPEKIPGVSDFLSFHTPPNRPVYSSTFSNEDNNLLHQFASLSTSGLISKVKELHDIAYQLGVEESKEMTRGKYLNILKRTQN